MVVPQQPDLPLALCAIGLHAPVHALEQRIYPAGAVGVARCRRCNRPLEGHRSLLR